MQKKINKESKKEITQKNSKKVLKAKIEFKENSIESEKGKKQKQTKAKNKNTNNKKTKKASNTSNSLDATCTNDTPTADINITSNTPTPNTSNSSNSSILKFVDALKLVGLFKKEIRNFEKKCKNELNNHFLSQSGNQFENNYDVNCSRDSICNIYDPSNLDKPHNLPYNHHNTRCKIRYNASDNNTEHNPRSKHTAKYNSLDHSYNQIQNSVFYRYNPFDVANSFLRPSQQMPKVDWSIWLLLTGRGFGKTFTGSNTVLQYVLSQKYKRICIISKTIEDVKKVMVEGESGITTTAEKYRDKINDTNENNANYVCDGDSECHANDVNDAHNENSWNWRNNGNERCYENDGNGQNETNTVQGDIKVQTNPMPIYKKSENKLVWNNGATATFYSADNIKKLRGPQFDFVWIDEAAKFTNPQEVFDQLSMCLRLGNDPKMIITTTPTPCEFLKNLIHEKEKFNLYITNGSTLENKDNLPHQYIRSILQSYENTPFGAQEIYGKIIQKQYILWDENTIQKCRLDSKKQQELDKLYKEKNEKMQNYELNYKGGREWSEESNAEINFENYPHLQHNLECDSQCHSKFHPKCNPESNTAFIIQSTSHQENAKNSLNKMKNQHTTQEKIQQTCSDILNLLQIKKVIVAIDPAVTEQGDETGIIVCGISDQSRIYILDDLSGNHNISQWCQIATNAYKNWNANKIVAEVNNGGDMIEKVLKSHAPEIQYTGVRADKNKITRMNPIFMLYQQNKVRHAQIFVKLEHQMTHMEQYRSPDRIDAMVWGVNELYWNSSKGKVVVSIL